MEEQGEDKAYRWEGDYEKTWEALKEDETGSLQASIEAEINKAKKRRLQQRQRNVRLGMMRHLYVVVDLSQAMCDQDLKPNRAVAVLKALEIFSEKFFDQNPISQLGFVSTCAKRAEVLSDMSGSLQKHIKVLQDLGQKIIKTNAKHCTGEPSLQNSLELCAKSLKHMPSHTSKEILVVMGSLTTCDPGSIHDTITQIAKQSIRCSVIGLSAEVHICKYLAKSTKGTFGIILDESHFADLLTDHVPPPAEISPESSLIKMGFPHHVSPHESGKISLCMSRNTFTVGGYFCPQCQAKYSELPVQCVICALTLVSAPHLARSYHHFFPLPMFKEQEVPVGSLTCYSCCKPITTATYVCEQCAISFCMDCNAFIHETLHSCPGCIISTNHVHTTTNGVV
uniref:General transcription factor IIH subunit n=1 Tax=Ciona intestinalis TaxID=7719 RepID=Q1RPX7_CIOIN|nr:zinc finger protein [Ciona intestinalis]BAE93308.1 zinc finger protein [Ciona intestinalis]|eukprot:NP_001071980.1 zinc finger protein [Ciona intestinalis]